MAAVERAREWRRLGLGSDQGLGGMGFISWFIDGRPMKLRAISSHLVHLVHSAVAERSQLWYKRARHEGAVRRDIVVWRSGKSEGNKRKTAIVV